jgi:haloalkane dehalogenase
MPTLPVLDSRMFFAETGANGGGETPIVFLHGNPTSSHVWRNVMARVGPGRCLAPDRGEGAR